MCLFLSMEVDNSRTKTMASLHWMVSTWRAGCARVIGDNVANRKILDVAVLLHRTQARTRGGTDSLEEAGEVYFVTRGGTEESSYGGTGLQEKSAARGDAGESAV